MDVGYFPKEYGERQNETYAAGSRNSEASQDLCAISGLSGEVGPKKSHK